MSKYIVYWAEKRIRLDEKNITRLKQERKRARRKNNFALCYELTREIKQLSGYIKTLEKLKGGGTIC